MSDVPAAFTEAVAAFEFVFPLHPDRCDEEETDEDLIPDIREAFDRAAQHGTHLASLLPDAVLGEHRARVAWKLGMVRYAITHTDYQLYMGEQEAFFEAVLMAIHARLPADDTDMLAWLNNPRNSK